MVSAHSQFPLDDDSAESVLTYALKIGIKHGKPSLSPPTSRLSILTYDTVVIVGHTECGGAKECLSATRSPPIQPFPPALTRWLSPLMNLAEKYKNEPANFEEAIQLLVIDNIRKQVRPPPPPLLSSPPWGVAKSRETDAMRCDSLRTSTKVPHCKKHGTTDPKYRYTAGYTN